MRQVALVAAHATRQGLHPGKTAWELGVEAFKGALRQAGIARDAIDGLVTQAAQDGSGLMDSTRFGQMVGLNPRTSGSLRYGTAIFSLAYAAAQIAAGQARLVACVYATNQRSGGYRFGEPPDPYGAPYGFLNPAGFAALGFQRYLYKYGRLADRDKLGAFALASRRHARLNPIAFRREPMAWEDYLQDRWIVWPLRRSDICLITDGAVCILVAEAGLAETLVERPVYVRGMARQDALRLLENDDHLLIPHMKDTARRLRAATGFGCRDIDALYIQDAHAAVVPATLENYGFCAPGEALDFIQDGRIEIGGELPVNSNGGQLSEGYMVGWLHHHELFHQLRGECGERQIENCNVAQFCATGGFRELTAAAIYSNSRH
ncbi:thiolase family protein [Pigmentiphaga soli]|uniref:Thiolase family protein n=1 Tax=Pigmentiphaga soli TaxID=1007095 RepID=A0ABP8GSP3_9BURK